MNIYNAPKPALPAALRKSSARQEAVAAARAGARGCSQVLDCPRVRGQSSDSDSNRKERRKRVQRETHRQLRQEAPARMPGRRFLASIAKCNPYTGLHSVKTKPSEIDANRLSAPTSRPP